MYMTLLSLLSLIIPLALMLVAMTINKKTSKNREKLSPFECGFDPMKKARMPFSMRFFLLTIIFLIFDVEIVIILPAAFIMKMTPTNMFSMYMLMIMILLIFGLLYEWNNGVLNWIY